MPEAERFTGNLVGDRGSRLVIRDAELVPAPADRPEAGAFDLPATEAIPLVPSDAPFAVARRPQPGEVHRGDA